MDDVAILEVLQKATTAAVAASTMPTLPVKHLGRDWTPPDDQKWLEIVFIPNNRVNDYWGNERNYQGLYRLILHWPNDDRGAYGPMGILKSVTSYFTKDLQLASGVRITVAPDAQQPLEMGREILYPSSARYACFRP